MSVVDYGGLVLGCCAVDYRAPKSQVKKFIKMTKFTCCSSLFSGAFSRDFTPQCRAFTRALHLQIYKPRYSPSAYGRKFQIIGALVVSYFYSLTLQ